MRTSALRKAVDAAIAARLAERGYREVSEGIYLLPLAPGIFGWVGVGLASRKRGGEVDADPMVGVRHDEVEGLMPTPSGEAEPTILRPLYELFPDGGYKTWSFTEANLEEQAEALVQSVVEHGQGLMHELKELDAIAEALTEWAFSDTRRTRLPVVLLLQGDVASAEAEVARQREMLADVGDASISAEYEQFAARLFADQFRDGAPRD